MRYRIVKDAETESQSISTISESLKNNSYGAYIINLRIANKFIDNMGEIFDKSDTLVVPSIKYIDKGI